METYTIEDFYTEHAWALMLAGRWQAIPTLKDFNWADYERASRANRNLEAALNRAIRESLAAKVAGLLNERQAWSANIVELALASAAFLRVGQAKPTLDK